MSRSHRHRAVSRDQARRRAALTHRWTVAAGSALTVIFGFTLAQHAAATTAPIQPGPGTSPQPATSGSPTTAAPESTQDSTAAPSPSTTQPAAPAPRRTETLQPPAQPPVATSTRSAKSGGS